LSFPFVKKERLFIGAKVILVLLHYTCWVYLGKKFAKNPNKTANAESRSKATNYLADETKNLQKTLTKQQMQRVSR
jgi:hypothetical protein